MHQEAMVLRQRRTTLNDSHHHHDEEARTKKSRNRCFEQQAIHNEDHHRKLANKKLMISCVALILVVASLVVLVVCWAFFSFEFLPKISTRINVNKNKGQSTSTITEDEETSQEKNKCSVYLAPSSVSGGGMGMFTVKNVKQGGMILPADGPSIPIIDYDDQSKASLDSFVNLFSSYWWESGTTDPALFEANHCVEYQITCGALPNSHPYLNNLDITHPAVVPYDDTIMDRATNPGAGASSYYMGRHSVASIDIDAGEEIFLKYPDHYMEYISNKYNIPARRHYETAGKIVSTLLALHGGDQISNWKDKTIYMTAADKVKALLPSTQLELNMVLSKVSDQKDGSEITLSIAKQLSVKKRSVDWIRENGICLDNMIPGKSLNPRAGQGAIAQRDMLTGEVIAPASLLQITDKDALRIPAFIGDKWQLLLNYCLGREDSSLLLCPNTNVILVNHCSDRRPNIHPCGKRGLIPNAKFQWANWDNSTSAWLNMTVDKMKEQEGRGLSLELVATRNIQEGEEIFIDYGIAWEQAWDEHVHRWRPPKDAQVEWKPAKILNDELTPLKIAPSLSEKYITMDNRQSLFTGCYYYDDGDSDFNEWVQEESNQSLWWLKIDKKRAIKRFGSDDDEDFEVFEDQMYSDGDFWPCVVIDKEEERDSYIVRIVQSDLYEDADWHKKNIPRIIRNYPSKCMTIVAYVLIFAPPCFRASF